MHVIIVAEDLSCTYSSYNIGGTNDSTFTISHTFPESGKYKLWVHFKPKGGNQTSAAFKFNVTSQPIHISTELVYDAKYTKQTLDDQYQISLKVLDKIVSQNDVDIAFSISDT
jgi:hypothetical protein